MVTRVSKYNCGMKKNGNAALEHGVHTWYIFILPRVSTGYLIAGCLGSSSLIWTCNVFVDLHPSSRWAEGAPSHVHRHVSVPLKGKWGVEGNS